MKLGAIAMVLVMLALTGTAAGAGRLHKFVFHVGTRLERVRLPGHARNFYFRSIHVRGGPWTMFVEGRGCTATGLCKGADYYGSGVALDVFQRGSRCYIRAVALSRHHTVVVRYRLG